MVKVDYLTLFSKFNIHSTSAIRMTFLTDILIMALCLGTYSVLNALYKKARHKAVW